MTPTATSATRWALALACAGALATPAQAQPSTTAAAPETSAAAAESPVQVRGFKVDGATLIDAGRLQARLAPWLGSRSLAQLRQAAMAVQGLYTAEGYGAVVAYLPPQAVDDGIVTIAVVEGRIGQVSVRGAKRQSAEQLRAALPSLVEGVTPRLRRIDAELQIANENPGRQVSVLLGPGSAPGLVEATVQVDEQALQRWNLALDNSGNRRTGDYRLSLGWQHADLSGHDDVLSVQLQTSPTRSSAVQVISAGYRLPMVRRLSALDLFAAYSNVDGGLTPTSAGNLSFTGKGRVAGARSIWYLPRRGEYDQRLTLGLEHRDYLNQCAISGLPAGACGPAGESVSVQPLSIDYAAQTGGASAAGFGVSLAHNLAWGGQHGSAASFASVRQGARPGYTVLRAAANLSLPVFDDWTLAGRVALQHSDALLVPGEQFGLGGAASVRGYQEREIAGDRGVLVSLELVSPGLLGAAGAAGVAGAPATDLRLLAFVDGGEVANRDATACVGNRSRCTLAAVGLGLRLNRGGLRFRLYLAQAQDDAISTRRKDWRAHGGLNLSF